MNLIKESYPNGECPSCWLDIPNDVANGESCVNCGHVFAPETPDDDKEKD